MVVFQEKTYKKLSNVHYQVLKCTLSGTQMYSNVHYQVLKCTLSGTQMYIIKSYLTLLKVGHLFVEPHICDYQEYCKLNELVDLTWWTDMTTLIVLCPCDQNSINTLAIFILNLLYTSMLIV